MFTSTESPGLLLGNVILGSSIEHIHYGAKMNERLLLPLSCSLLVLWQVLTSHGGESRVR